MADMDERNEKEIAKYETQQDRLPQSEVNLDTIVRFLQEYMKAYVVFGYDLHGNRVVISDCNTPQDLDSVKQLAKQLYREGNLYLPEDEDDLEC